MLLIQSSGFPLFFKAQEIYLKNNIKLKIKKGIPESDLIMIKIPNDDDLRKQMQFEMIHSKEFRYKGEMYDIIRANITEDTSYYFVIHDPKETGLFAKLDQYANEQKQSDPFQKALFDNINKLYKLIYLNDISDFVYQIRYTIIELIITNLIPISHFYTPEPEPPNNYSK